MKTGKTLIELATEIERQSKAKRDFVAATDSLEMIREESGHALQVGDLGAFAVNDVAHSQLAEYTGIPQSYYNKLLQEPNGIFNENVNYWLKKSSDKRMVRTMDGRARAFLSDRYRPLENDALAEAVLPRLMEIGVEIVSCEITEKRLYIKAVDKSIEKDIPTGKKLGSGHTFFDTLSPAITISNSEVGKGSLSLLTGVWTRACTNLATVEKAIRKYHIGAKHELAEGFAELLTDKTRLLSDAATWAQIGDVVRGAFDKARFDALALKIGGMVDDKIAGDPVKVVEVTAKKFGLVEAERTSVLRHLIEGGDLTRYGLFNSITRTAEDLDSYDRASEFERLGGDIIELPKKDWHVISTAA